MLARAGFGDDPGLAHAAREQDLAEAIVDLVAAGMVQLVALEIDLGAAEVLRQSLGEIEGAGSAGVVLVEIGQFGPESRIILRLGIGGVQFQDQRHQGLGDEPPAIEAEEAAIIGAGPHGVDQGRRGGSRSGGGARCHARIPSVQGGDPDRVRSIVETG